MLDSSDSSTTSTSITQLNCSPDSLHCCSGKQLPLVFTVLLMLMMQTHHGSYPEVQCEKRSVGAGGGWCNWAQFQAMQLNQVWKTHKKKKSLHTFKTQGSLSQKVGGSWLLRCFCIDLLLKGIWLLSVSVWDDVGHMWADAKLLRICTEGLCEEDSHFRY